MLQHSPAAPSELPHAAAARRLWLTSDGPHHDRLIDAEPWVARWGHLARGTEVAILWDGHADAAMAAWVATRLGLSVTLVTHRPLPPESWQPLDDQAVAFGGSLRHVQELPGGCPVVRPAA